MTNTTETVTLFNKEGISDLIELLEDYPQNPQSFQDLLLTTLILGKGLGIEYESVLELVTNGWKMAEMALTDV